MLDAPRILGVSNYPFRIAQEDVDQIMTSADKVAKRGGRAFRQSGGMNFAASAGE
jgi:hypothetical protein